MTLDLPPPDRTPSVTERINAAVAKAAAAMENRYKAACAVTDAKFQKVEEAEERLISRSRFTPEADAPRPRVSKAARREALKALLSDSRDGSEPLDPEPLP